MLGQLSGYERDLAENMLALPLGDPRREAIRTQLLDASYGRFNTYQEFSLPMMLGGFLSFTPQAGIGYTRYFSAAGPESDSNRTQLHVGRGILAEILQGPRPLSEPPLGARRPAARVPTLWQLVGPFHR